MADDDAASRPAPLQEMVEPAPAVPFPKLLVVDLDGTLLGGGYVPYARIPEPVCAFLNRLGDCGCDWATNTAWPIEDQWKMLKESAVRHPPAFLVGEYGRVVARPGKDGPVPVEPYTSRANERAAQLARQYMLPIIAEVVGGYAPTRIQYYQHLTTFAFASDDRKAADLEARSRRWPGVTVRGKPELLIVQLEEITKGHGIAEIARLCGYHPHDVVVAGDEIADIPMMNDELAFHVVCPANANPLVKTHVFQRSGIVAPQACGLGIINAFEQLAHRYRWEFSEKGR